MEILYDIMVGKKIILTEDERKSVSNYIIERSLEFDGVDRSSIESSVDRFVQELPSMADNLRREIPNLSNELNLSIGEFKTDLIKYRVLTPMDFVPPYLKESFGNVIENY